MIDLDYYDTLLVAIAGSLLGGASLALVTSITLHVGVVGGALVATVFVYEAVYRNPPLPPSDARVKAVLAVWHVGLVALLLGLFAG